MSKQDKDLSDDIYALYMKDVNSLKDTDYTETNKLMDEYVKTRDKELQNKIVEANLKLVITLVNMFCRGKNDYSIREELISVGNFELIQCMDRFDPIAEVKFSSYASKCILEKVKATYYKDKFFINLSSSGVGKYYEMKNAYKELEKELGRVPSVDEVADYLKCSTKAINDIMNALGETVSLNSTVKNDDSDTELIQLIADSKTCVEDEGIENEYREFLFNYIRKEYLKNFSKYSEEELDTILEFGRLYSLSEVNDSKELQGRIKELIPLLPCNKESMTEVFPNNLFIRYGACYNRLRNLDMMFKQYCDQNEKWDDERLANYYSIPRLKVKDKQAGTLRAIRGILINNPGVVESYVSSETLNDLADKQNKQKKLVYFDE